ncbi:MAG: hypothetical protein HC889_04835 [Synechococcaceae cyanobacterium SM1_2_3]|nr:hypothetical protein [Synechococcaceae cyanobacterium SM1_2_3]
MPGTIWSDDPALALFGETVHPVLNALAELNPDHLNPEQALIELKRLKKLSGS